MGKHVLFYDPAFPYRGTRPEASELAELKKYFIVSDAQSIGDSLRDNPTACLVMLHGSYFPKDAWSDILGHLRAGGGLVSIGGAPFQIPVRRVAADWVEESVQVAYHRQLHIHASLAVAVDSVQWLVHNPAVPLLQGQEQLFSIEPTYGLVIQGTHTNDRPGEQGTSGAMEAHIYPLLKGVTSDNREVAAPVVLIEHTKADFAGGRWLFVNQTVGAAFWSNGGAEVLTLWSEFCARGVTELWVHPDYACYQPGDRPSITIQTQKIAPSSNRLMAEPDAEWALSLTVYALGQQTRDKVWSEEFRVRPTHHWDSVSIPLSINLQSGLYVIECVGQSATGERRTWTTGFWGADVRLLSSGERLKRDRDYFWKDGRPLPVVGMTYMTSDVARKYLFMPNPAVWDRDMAQMKKAGINLIRTGIWTGWRQVMFIDGHATESVLRAIDAFLLTAKRHDIEVTFNFFAFTPETWEGRNPYLDPQSVEAQKRFIGSIVSRHRDTKNVHWDLINEPSVFDPKRVFQGPRSAKDGFEHAAWVSWLTERHGHISLLQARWDMTPDELPDFASANIPEREDINFGITNMGRGKRGQRWLDYCLFTMDMFNRWVREMSETIRSYTPDTLITVGQDEGLASQRPSPLFYADTVDYTTVHSWWQMDQLVWDGVFTKSFDRPNLVQETGIMYVENTDSSPKRTEEELRNILERKYAYAFATGGAGAVQWLWNTNFYMNDANEINIGALRADGTEKPEADISYDFGRFISEARDLFVDRQLEDVVVVYPYSNDFSNRSFAFDATTHLTRTLSYDLKVPFRAVGEYHLVDALRAAPPRLMMVPSAHHFSSEARDTLLNHIRDHGGTLLWTGPLHRDAYWNELPLIDASFECVTVGNVLREEKVNVGGQPVRVVFPQLRIAEVSKEVVRRSDTSAHQGVVQVYELSVGRGTLLWCPLPVELGNSPDALARLYALAIHRAGIQPELEWKSGMDAGVFGRKLTFSDGALMVFVSEAGYDNNVVVTDPVTQKTYAFSLPSERSVLFSVDQYGAVTNVYRFAEVDIQVS